MYDIFSLPSFTMPKGFIWGASTAGHQIEGNNIHSNYWQSEIDQGFTETSGMACNSYTLYQEDIELIKHFEHNGYRYSVEWSRIEPTEGQFNDEATNHYVDLAKRLKDAGIKNYITLHHFTHPLWFEKLGSFEKIENIRYFERYCEHIIPKLAPYVDGWTSINEFNGCESQVNRLKFYARAYHIIKKYSTAPVGSAHSATLYWPRRPGDYLDELMTKFYDFQFNEFYFHAIRTGELIMPNKDAEYSDEVKGAADFWGLNYYTRFMVDSRKEKSKDTKRFNHLRLKMLPMDYYMEEFFPEGLTNMIMRLKDKPVYITEHGVACNDDRFRVVNLAVHLSAICEAIEMGADVKGYFHWSLMDNYEWSTYIPKFGLVDVDFNTFKRTPKPSAYFYRDIIRQNGCTPEIIKRYLKELPTL